MSVEIPLQDFLEHYAPVSDFLQNLLAPERYLTDFTLVRGFLAQYTDEQSTFLSYRQSAERLLLWSWLVANKSILDLSVLEIKDFIAFNKMPPDHWQTACPPETLREWGGRNIIQRKLATLQQCAITLDVKQLYSTATPNMQLSL